MAKGDPTFGELLRHFRLAANLSQQALAERAQLSVDAIAALERSRRRPRPATVDVLSTALGLPAADSARLSAAAQAPAAAAPPPLQAIPITPLPIPPTRLVGRAREVRIATTLLRPANPAEAVRLLTLIGPGGVGKTRLALAIAAALQPEFADGTLFISLSTIRDPALVPLTILQHLGLPEVPELRAEQQLAVALRDKRLLLVLDNLEQVLPATPLIAAALAAAPGLQVLATSRSPLRLYGEQELWVPPLQLPARPDRWGPGDGEQAAQSEAVQLFAQRARAVQLGFELTEGVLPVVAEICTALDGLPLAIELAAARIRLFSPSELLARLTSRQALLVDGPRDLPERQRTIHNTIAWSYDLLSPTEQAVLMRISICVGGFTLAAVEALCAVAPAPRAEPLCAVAPAPRAEPPDTIESLLGKSLLRRELGHDGNPRFGMLGTIREYVYGQLAASPAFADIERSHAGYYLALLSHADTAIMGPAQVAWLNQLEAEHDNLRAMLAYYTAHDPAPLLGSIDALGRFWLTHGYFGEGRGWLQAVLAHAELPGLLRAKTLSWAALLARRQGDYAGARVQIEAALALWQALGDHEGIDMTLTSYGFLELDRGETAHADELFAASQALNRAAAHQRGLAIATTGRSLVALSQGEYARAHAQAGASLSLWLQIGDTLNAANARTNLGHALAGMGEQARAIEQLMQALSDFYALGDRPGVAECLEGLAGALGAREPLRAAQMLGKAEALREESHIPRSQADRRAYERIVARACAGLNEASRRGAIAAGRALQLDQVIGDLQRYVAHDHAAV